jgi:hypothetical protein
MTPGLEVIGQTDARAYGRCGEVQGQHAGDGELPVAAGDGHPGSEHVDEQQGEQDRLHGHVGELQRLSGDVEQVAPGQHGDVAHPPAQARGDGRP